MTEDEFNKRLLDIDRELANRGIPTIQRPMVAWFRLTGARELPMAAADPKLGPYDGPNLLHAIGDWYKRLYPQQSVIRSWGRRLMIIRGEVFRVRLPTIFNPSAPIDAREYIQNLSADLWGTLTQEEREAIQADFDVFFRQTSDMLLCITVWAAGKQGSLLADLLLRGWTDLDSCCGGFNARFPTAVLFGAQQATEKYLKAVLVQNEPSLTDADLRKTYGHRLGKLLAACAVIDGHFHQVEPHIDKLDFTPNIRYRDVPLSSGDVIYRVNLAHSICHLVARRLLNVGKAGGAGDAPTANDLER